MTFGDSVVDGLSIIRVVRGHRCNPHPRINLIKQRRHFGDVTDIVRRRFCQPSRHRVDGARCVLIVGIGMECGARYVDPRLSASGLSGQRKATAGTGSVGLLNRVQYPSDVIALVVLWRLRYKLSLRDLAEMFLTRGFIFSYEAVRDWEAKLTPAALAENACVGDTQRQDWPQLVRR